MDSGIPIDPMERIEQLLSMLEEAVGIANQRKAEVERLEERVRELEKNKDQFQARRDEAIREAERKTTILNKVMEASGPAVEVGRCSPKPGDLVVVRLRAGTTSEAMQTVKYALEWIKQRNPGVTFVLAAPGAHIDFERSSEVQLRAMGLIASARVDAGMQQLEVAFGTQQAALRTARRYLGWIIEGKTKLDGLDKGIAELIAKLDALLKAELIPDPRPDLRPLLEEAIHYLNHGAEVGDTAKQFELAGRIAEALKVQR